MRQIINLNLIKNLATFKQEQQKGFDAKNEIFLDFLSKKVSKTVNTDYSRFSFGGISFEFRKNSSISIPYNLKRNKEQGAAHFITKYDILPCRCRCCCCCRSIQNTQKPTCSFLQRKKPIFKQEIVGAVIVCEILKADKITMEVEYQMWKYFGKGVFYFVAIDLRSQ